jgi:TRAP-type C4-dicarboxylate transport system substrate-binding protein
MKMIAGGEYGKLQGEALGWALVSCTPPEAYEMWEKGVADGGGVCVVACLISLNWGEVLKYVTLVPMMRAPHTLGVNVNAWNKLQPQDQKIIEDMVPEVTDMADKMVQEEQNDAFERAPDLYGVEFISLSQEELDRWTNEVQRPVVEDVIAQLEAKGVAARKVFEAYWQLEKKYSAPEYEYK